MDKNEVDLGNRPQPIELDKYFDGKAVLGDCIDEIIQTEGGDLAAAGLKQILNDVLDISDGKIIFSHAGQEYHMGTKKKVWRGTDNYDDIQEDLILHGGNLKDLVKSIIAIKQFINQNKNLKWLRYMKLSYLWGLAASEDYLDPKSYFKKRENEIKNSLGLLGSRAVENITVRNGNENIRLNVVETEKMVEEAPIKIRVSSTDQDNASVTDEIHTVVIGREDDETATIYAVQLGRIMDVSKQMLENLRLLDRPLEYKEVCEKVKDECEGIYNDLDKLIGWDVEDVQEREKALQEWGKFAHWYKDHPDNKSLNMIKYLKMVELLSLEKIDLEFKKRSERLKRFNHGTANGGARMVSFVSALLLLKESGVKKVKIPLELPMAEHIYPKDGDESKNKAATITYIRAGLIQVVQGFSRMYKVDISGNNDSYLIDISDWKPEEVLVGDSKVIKSLAVNFNK